MPRIKDIAGLTPELAAAVKQHFAPIPPVVTVNLNLTIDTSAMPKPVNDPGHSGGNPPPGGGCAGSCGCPPSYPSERLLPPGRAILRRNLEI
jgi:hypothetical protein